MFFLQRKHLRVNATPDVIQKALERHQDTVKIRSISNESFSLNIAQKTFTQRYSYACFYGTFNCTEEGCVLNYSVKPNIGTLLGMIVIGFLSVLGFLKFLFTSLSIHFALITGIIFVIIFLDYIGFAQRCNSKLLRILNDYIELPS